MKNLLFILSIICFLTSCSIHRNTTNKNEISNENSISVQDGSSYENAIVIEEKTETKGIDAEYEWIRNNYPNSKVNRQSLDFYKDKPYDIISISTETNENKDIYFNISNFFGKY